ncbi:NADH dehydrogenase [ubiquinone] 1 subunit C2 [Protobothrops mucrosquamatus]|uniref:NADH dehydrogenase [ubiquinone] 1 subunit C2 n=1 Tax=Protobothrops mucrosquamatus TaxID=103944 RepID=UPI000775792C|nr:NADH dehydrogenase [ubiquinone] 1 subunit C2 [Protobothrops mucrosquamatus]
MQLRFSVPNEALSLPPPPLLTFPSVWMAGIFWISTLLHNGVNRRPALRAGVHRQVLMATLGFCLGYYIKRYSNYYYAERDRELFSYIKHHPEDFVEKEPRKMGDILEDFVPTR